MAHEDTLYLVDGSGFIFRAYFGLRTPMTAADGTPTNAVFGFMRLLMALLKERNPAHVAVVFDPKGGSFRSTLYEAYKANRQEPPDDLKPQFALCREATTALGIPALEVAGYEADDVIGTLATRWTETGRPCVVVTADKDMMQLVGDLIRLHDGKEKEIGRAEVIERFGVPPERVIDVLGLAGDASDNIPGVPGIGEKTAALLLQEHGDLESLLARAGEIKGKRGAALVEHADMARLSARLATIVRDAPIELDEAALARTPPAPAALTDFLRRMKFNQFLKELGLSAPDEKTNRQIDRSVYRTVLSPEALAATVAEIRAAGRLSFDLETTGLDTLTARIVGFALAWAPGQAAYVPVAHAYPGAPEQLSKGDVVDALRPLLSDPEFPKLGQNVKYEWQVLNRDVGVDYRGVAGDSMLAAYLLDANRRAFNLDELSAEYLGHRMLGFQEVTARAGADGPANANDGRFGRVDVATATQYAAEDADVALRLCDTLHPRLVENGLDPLYRAIELPLARVLARMELWGIRLDPTMLRDQSRKFAGRIGDLEREIHDLAGGPFNVGSTKQLGDILFERLQLPTGKKTKTGYSTDQAVLEGLATKHPLPRLVLEYRHLTKLKSTYLDTLPTLIHPVTARLHTSFRQAVAATGRLSSSDPNLQNIPIRTQDGRDIRRAFVAEPGWRLLSADYSQIELRVLAHVSGDPGLRAAFADGADVHARTAAQVFGIPQSEVTPEQRRQAKAINFGLIYGMGPFRLAGELGIQQADAKRIIERYFEQYPGVKAFFERVLTEARTTKSVRTLFGRVRGIPEIDSTNGTLRQGAERVALNTPIQGTAADLLKVAMIRLDAALEAAGHRSRILLTVHDELVLEVPEDELEVVSALVRREMEGAGDGRLDVPLVVEMGSGLNWAEIH
jgi:DNA polymerase-1